MPEPTELPNPTSPPITLVRVSTSVEEVARRLATGEPIDSRAIIEEAAAVWAERTGVVELPPHRGLLLEGAAWCDDAAPAHEAAVARLATLDAAVEEATVRAARSETRLADVAEQQVAAEAVLDSAQKQLLELDVAGKTENEVRRELEGANLEARHANLAAETARARAEAITLELLEVEQRRTAIDAARTELAALAEADPEPVAAALARVEQVPLVDPDPATLALADELERRQAQLAAATAPDEAVTPEALHAAEAAARAARDHLEELRQPPSTQTPPWWGRLSQLHNAVVDAEAAAGATLARPSARKRLEEAIAAERALLDEVGCPSYLDAIMTGGRPVGPRRTPEAIAAAEDAVAETQRRLAALRAAAEASAARQRARADVGRLRALGGALLGAPGAPVTPEDLRRPRPDPTAAAALTAAALATAETTVGDADPIGSARRWLAQRRTLAAKLEALDHERAELLTRCRTMAPEAEAATADAESRSTAARAARRRVEVLEADLADRIRPVADPNVRAATAAALRDRIGALEARIERARIDAESTHLEAVSVLAQATARAEEARRDVDADIRAAAGAVALLPAGDDQERVVTNDLRAVAELLRAAAGEPTPDDHAEAVRRLADPARRSSDVLVEPVAAVPAPSVGAVLDALPGCAAERPIVIVSAHPDLVAWANALPAGTGTVVSAEALQLGPAPADGPDLRTTHPAPARATAPPTTR